MLTTTTTHHTITPATLRGRVQRRIRCACGRDRLLLTGVLRALNRLDWERPRWGAVG